MPAYVVVARFRTRNSEELELYRKEALAFITSPSITWLARFERCETKEGPAVESVAIFGFQTFEEARAWYDSPGYQDACKHRFAGGDYSTIIVEGVQEEIRPPLKASAPAH